MAFEDHLHAEQESRGVTPPRSAMFVAGALAYLAATCQRDAGDPVEAVALALHSASWSRHVGDSHAEAEALQLAGDLTPDAAAALPLYERAIGAFDQCGAWPRAAECRRARARRIAETEGPAAAHTALAEARLALDAVLTRCRTTPDADPGEAAAAQWQILSLAEETVDILTEYGQAEAALAFDSGLEAAYRAMGDERSARRSVLTRARTLVALNRPREAIEQLTVVANEALAAADTEEALYLGGSMAQMLDSLGRHQEAERAWARYWKPAPGGNSRSESDLDEDPGTGSAPDSDDPGISAPPR